MDSVPKTYLAELVAARTEVRLSAALIREIDARAEREAKAIMKDPALRKELTTLALEAIRAAWQSLRQANRRTDI